VYPLVWHILCNGVAQLDRFCHYTMLLCYFLSSGVTRCPSSPYPSSPAGEKGIAIL
jgi:hypothetical protein